MDEHKLKVKFGNFEFEAYGTEASVQKQFELFMKGVNAQPPASETKRTDMPKHERGRDDEVPADDRPRRNNGPLDPELIASAFAQDAKGTVSLKALPDDSDEPAADALLLILYGYRVVKNQNDVLVTQLALAARQSGTTIDRIDRAIAARQGLFLKAGARRGGKYQLNNRGVQHVETLLKGMFE
jgi:hypothetical protein